MPPLPNPRWEIVALALANGDNQKHAYSSAGFKYNVANASKLCRHRDVVARVTEIRAERAEMEARTRIRAAEEAGVDRAWIITHLRHNALAALRGEPVRDREGRIKRDPDTGAPIYKPDRDAANKALELLGRSHGIFIDRHEVGGPGDFSRMTEAELDAKINELGNKLGLPEDVKLLEWFDPAKRGEGE